MFTSTNVATLAFINSFKVKTTRIAKYANTFFLYFHQYWAQNLVFYDADNYAFFRYRA